MLPEKIKERIAQYYLPGYIGNYDQIITIEHFESLFAPIENVNHEQILIALAALGFDDDSVMDTNFFIIFV